MNSSFLIGLGLVLIGVGNPERGKDRDKKPAPNKKGAAVRPMVLPVPVVPAGVNGQVPAQIPIPVPPPAVIGPQGPIPIPVPAPVIMNNFVRPIPQPMAPAFGAIRDLPKELVPALVEALQDPDKAVRQYSAGALAEVGKDAVEPLLAALKDKDAARRANAAYVLGHLGADARADALPLLIKALKDESKEVRVRAAFAIQRLAADARQNPYGMPMPIMTPNMGNGQGRLRGVTLPADPGTVAPSAREEAKPRKEPAKEEAKPRKEPARKAEPAKGKDLPKESR